MISAVDAETFEYKSGGIELFTLVEAAGQGNSSVLLTDEPTKARFFPGNTYMSQTNVFVVKTPRSVTLVDTGFGRELLANLALKGIKKEDVGAILLTHSHGDHIGGLIQDGKALFPNAILYLSEAEKAFWTNAPALSLYKTQSFTPGSMEKPLPLFESWKAVSAFGHTPGHTAFLWDDGTTRLFFVGDLVHVEDIQFTVPETPVRYDANAEEAVKTRLALFDYAVKNGIPIAGAHLREGAAGLIVKQKTGYAWSPFVRREPSRAR